MSLWDNLLMRKEKRENLITNDIRKTEDVFSNRDREPGKKEHLDIANEDLDREELLGPVDDYDTDDYNPKREEHQKRYGYVDVHDDQLPADEVMFVKPIGERDDGDFEDFDERLQRSLEADQAKYRAKLEAKRNKPRVKGQDAIDRAINKDRTTIEAERKRLEALAKARADIKNATNEQGRPLPVYTKEDLMSLKECYDYIKDNASPENAPVLFGGVKMTKAQIAQAANEYQDYLDYKASIQNKNKVEKQPVKPEVIKNSDKFQQHKSFRFTKRKQRV